MRARALPKWGGTSDGATPHFPPALRQARAPRLRLPRGGRPARPAAGAGGQSVNWSYYHPDWFLINGKADPDAAGDPDAAISARVGQTVLLRLINMGYLIQQVSLGGLSFQVIASDGRPLPAPQAATEWTVAPGERYDLLFALETTGTWNATVRYLNWYQGDIRGTAHTTITAT